MMAHTTDSFIEIIKNTNLYGQEHAFGKLDKLDCDEIKRIANEPFFSQETIDQIFGEHIDFTKAGDKRFVATDEEKIRISIILISAKANIFLLLEGPTSSSKTYSALIAFNIFINTNYFKTMQKALYPNSKRKTPKNIILRINLSEDSSREDFIGSIVHDDTINRFIFKQGAFSKAFEYGYWLLIDELSLAPPNILQAIEAALDIKLLIVQGLGVTREIKMHPNFFVICTTNPNNEEYPRYNLPSQFLDRFHKIYFDSLSNEEMEKIMIEKCQRKNIDDKIQKVIEAHKKYTGPHGPQCKNMYTLRELDRACILFERNLHYDYERIIDILYRTRAGDTLLTYDANNNIFNDIPDVIETDDRIKYGQLALDCLDNGFNIILENDFNSGNSDFAKIIAKKYNIIKKNPFLPLIVSMTNELRVTDLTELPILFSKVHGEQKEMKIKIIKGVIYKAAEEGRVLIFEDLERGNTKVLESINDIYECNPVYSEINKLQRNINLHKNFRIIYTMHSNVPHKISAAFFNRFIHIKMKNNCEIANYFHIPKGIPLNIKAQNFPDSIHIENSNDLCKNAKVACTKQIDAIFKYTKASIDSKIPVCILGESGYGRNIAINLILKDKFKDQSKISTIYCTSETTREMLIGKYLLEGHLLFNEGSLIRAATKGGVLIIKNIDKLTHHAFSCIETVLNFIKKEDHELIIPGFDLSKYKFSKEFYCIATIDDVDERKIPNYILKNFVIKKIPEPTENDYIEIYKSICKDYVNHKTEFDTLVKCFLSCNDMRNVFDTSFRMFTRVLISFERNYQAELLKEQAINMYALFQNAKTKNKENLIAKLLTKIDFNVSEIDKQISSDVYIKGNQLVKGPLACSKIQFQQLEMLKSLSKEQLNVVFYLKLCKTPIVLIGSTSFRETIIRQNVPNKVKSFNVADFTTTDDMIGNISIKRNIQPTGQFKHGDIYDILIEYMSNDISTNESIAKLDLNSYDSFEKVKEIIEQMDDGKLKPYYQYLMNIVEHENDHATFFELGYLTREILLGNTVLLKNIDQLKASVIDSLIPFLNETIDLNEYIPGITYSPQHCQLFFTCSDQEYDQLSTSFRSRVQAVYIGALGKDDIRKYVDDNILLDAYDDVIHDYSDITRAINIIKIASVLNNFDSPEERISIAKSIISINPENYDENKVFGTLKEEKKYSLEELINYDKNTSELKSLRTGATIKVENYDESKLLNFVYVPSVACLLDLCIISIATHIPLIVESMPGQSKSTLIMKFGEAIGKNVNKNNMSKNKTPEYFIGQIQPNENGFDYEIGNLYNSIENDDIYLIDEINLSGSSLLTYLLTIFKTPYNESIIHPRCNRNFNKKFNLFATMNPAALTPNRKNLTSGFLSCSIIYQMPCYRPYDNTQIISSILSQFKDILEDYDQSLNFIIECHKKCLELSNDVTIRDMLKLAEGFIEIAKSDKKISKEKIANLVQMIYSSKMINWNDEFEKKSVEYKGISKKIKIPNNITKPQFLLMEQMEEAIKMNRGIILRGPSGNGKTFCIQKFSDEHLPKDKKLFIIQLCSQSDISEIFGRLEPEYPDIIKMGNKIKNIIINMMETNECSENMKELFSEYLDELNNNENIYSVFKMMESDKEIMNITYLSQKIEKYLRKSKNIIRFIFRKSPLIYAMKKGHWVVLENINLCPDDILESLNSLLDESHTLRINDGEKDIVYSMNPNGNSENEKEIDSNFRIFMTSDDRILSTAKSIPAPFLSRCIVLQINSPKIDELPNIARNYYDATMFADFLCKCFKKHTNNHVRDIIRMTQMYRILNVNPNTSKPEISIAKTLNYILNKDYIIPNAFIIPNREYDHIVKEILSIIQKNLLDGNLEDSSFSPWTGEIIKNVFTDAYKANQINDLCLFFKATLKLACYIFAKKSQDEFISLLNTISGKLITFLVCGYIITISDNKQKEIPNFIWNLHFKPAIWDLLFVSNDRYVDFTTKAGFIEFLRSDIDETGEFAFEFYQYSKLNTNEYEKDKEKYSNIVDTLFNRKVFDESEEESIINVNEKNLIILEKLPLIFPSIIDSKLIFEAVNYSELIQIFDFLNIHPPFNEMMKIFNYDFMKCAIFNDYNFRFNNPPNLNTAKIYNKLLEYDLLYQHIKFICQIPNDSDDISEIIKKNISQNNITMDLLINKIDEMKKYCISNKTEITESLLEIIHNSQNIIQISIQQKREKDELNKMQIEIFNRIKKLIPKVRNKFIIDEIENLRSSNQLTDELYHQIEKLVLFDSHISKRNAFNYIKYKYNGLQNYSLPDVIREKIKFSVIITNFIVPPSCQNFLISPDVYSQFNKYSFPKLKIRELTDIINKNALNKDQVNYTYLEQILKENSMNKLILPKADLLNKKYISKIISYMDQFFINKCIVSNACRNENYIKSMQHRIDKDIVKRSLEKKKQKSKEEIDKLYNQYELLLKKLNEVNDDDDYDDEDYEKEIPIDVLRSNVDIPPEDLGQIILPWDQKYDNNSKAQLAHYLTKLDALDSKINNFPIENIELNNQEYQIIRIESLYYNYIYLTNLENIDQSVAAELNIVDTFNIVKESTNPLQILKKDIILFLSKTQRKNVNEKEMKIIKKAITEIWENDNLDIKNDYLHILYDPHFRSKMIQYYNEKDLYDEFKQKINNYSIENEIRKIKKSIQDISIISNQIYNEIKATFCYLLQHESKENQFMLDGITKYDEESFIKKILELAKKFLKDVYPGSNYNERCIQISVNENSFIQRYNKLSVIGFFERYIGQKNVYEESSLKYDDRYVRIDQYNTFTKCYNEYKNWCKLDSSINSILNIPIQEYYFPRIINTINGISKDSNQEISNLCTKILNDIQNVRETERVLERFRIQREPEIPKIYFENNKEPFRDIRDHLMIENNNGKAQLLAEINYDLRECYPNSQIKLNIINMSHSTVRTIPETIIDQTNESIFISMNLNKENQKIELINNNDNSRIGILNFECKFIHPEIFFVFSSPVKIENKTIYIKGIIYHQLTISIFSKSSVMSHHLQLDTLDGSELSEKNVSIQNTNEKITLTFSDSGKFKANMQIIFSANNININALINIDIDVDPNEHSFIYDAKTMEEIKSNEILTAPSYLIVKSPIKPEIENQLQYWLNVRNIPYLHIIYASNHSIIKTMNNIFNLKFGESYCHIDLNKHMNPKLTDFEKSLKKWNFYFKYTGSNVYLSESCRYDNVILKFIFSNNVIEKLSFVEIPYEKKNYSDNGLYISKYNFENNNLKALMKQIEDTQHLHFTETSRFIPWINIIKLFEKPENETIGKCIQNISKIRNFYIRDDQTFYVKATESSLISIDKIPDFSNKQITQNIISTTNINTNEFNNLKTIDPSNLFDIIKNLDEIKLGMQFYRQIYESDSEEKLLAANISCIYRSLKFLDKCKIMENTLNEVISIGHTLFQSNNKTSNIEIINDKNESTENITFKYYKNKEKNEMQKSNEDNPNLNELKNKNKISPSYNTLDIIRPTELISDTTNKILLILSGEEVNEKDEYKKVVRRIEENKEIIEEDTNENYYVTPLNTNSINVDEINGPKIALKIANSINNKRYGLSNIEIENKNIYLPNVKIKEGKNPNIDKYIIKVLESLVKYDFSISLPENHITLLVDISFLSGSQNKNILCLNLFVAMETLNALGINFGVWMFADRPLRVCVKKPTDPYDNARKTIIREFYFLNRKNSESSPLSALYAINKLDDDKDSSLFIIFSTFISAQILSKYTNWQETALSCLDNRNLIGYIEPCQYIDEEISSRLNEVLTESSFTSFVRFRKNIYESIAELLMKIFALSLSKNKYQTPNVSNALSINLPFNKFENNITFESDIYICQNKITFINSNLNYPEYEKLKATQINGDFEEIDLSNMKFGNSNYGAYFLCPNKATKYEPSSKGPTIDNNGLIKFYCTGGAYTDIFKQLTGDKIRDYCVDIVIDCSLIIKKYSLNHCFLSIVSLLSSLKELEIPCVNLFAAGKELITILANQNLYLLSSSDALYSKIFSILIENASETRSLDNALKTAISHSFDNTSKIIFVFTDCLFEIEQEKLIKDKINYAQTKGHVIGIGTGPAPFKLEEIFSLGVWAKDPYMLRKALFKLGQSTGNKNEFKSYISNIGSELPDEIPNMKLDSPNSLLLKQFEEIEYYNPCIPYGINEKAFGKDELTGDYAINSSFNPFKKGKYKGIKILVMMFYQGKKNSRDEPITVESFEKGISYKDSANNEIKSPGEMIHEMGSEYKIVTKYKDALEELVTGTYSIALLCTASKGISKGSNDENYFESFIKAIVDFFVLGGGLIMFAENPPFNFEINEILKALPGFTVRIDENRNNYDKDDSGFMHESKGDEVGPGEFLNHHYTCSATINGDHYNELPSLGGGIKELFTGSTPAKFINIDKSFKIFSMTPKGNPSCIYRIPEGHEGLIIIDAAASKLFFEYTSTGTARYINNLPFICIHCSHFRRKYNDFETDAGIAIDTAIEPQISTRFRHIPPLLISIIIDATGSMSQRIITCKEKLTKLIEKCKEKVDELKIYLQFVAYRDICDINESYGMIESHEITNDPDKIQKFMEQIVATGGGDGPENIAVGYETALCQIESSALECNNIFIHLGDSPNHDSSLSGSHHQSGNEKGVSWDEVWKSIDKRIGEQNINKIITISCNDSFDKQYEFWDKYNCTNINKILDKKSISSESLESIIENYIPDAVATMYG